MDLQRFSRQWKVQFLQNRGQVPVCEFLHGTAGRSQMCTHQEKCTNSLSLQKGSPYTEDVNRFIHLANQIGLIDSKIKEFMPHVSKCATWSNIQASHNSDKLVQLKLEAFYGILGLLAITLAGVLITFIVELSWGHSITRTSQRSPHPTREDWLNQ